MMVISTITWLLFASLIYKISLHGDGKEDGVFQCGPRDMTLATSDQTILLTWEDDPSCFALHDDLMYELEVRRAGRHILYEAVAVTPGQIGRTHSWNWTSPLPLTCVSHSVGLRPRYKNHTSPWRQEHTLPAIDNSRLSRPEVFPKDRVFRVGSTATFCCVLPAGATFDKMYLNGYQATQSSTTLISSQTYALTVRLDKPSTNTCIDVKCHANASGNGACVYIGYAPADKDLVCETRDLQSAECLWTVGRNTHLPFNSPTVYQLLGSPCPGGSKGKCSKVMQVDAGEQNFTLTVQNQLGLVELTHSADLTKRVHMFAPREVKASAVNARNVSLQWKWTVQKYSDLDMKCQVNVSSGEADAISEKVGVGLNFAVLDDLIPNWTYTATLRCGTRQDFWKWSEWSSSVDFRTRGDVPDALDVWMQMKEDQVIIIWKMPRDNQSHGQIIDYEVMWAPTKNPERRNRTTVSHLKQSLALSLDSTEEHVIGVTARNVNGSSPPSALAVPPVSPVRAESTRILGRNGGFYLSWSASPAASCGYIVDWCPVLGNGTVDWLKVPPGETDAGVFSKKLTDGRRYSLSVYACNRGAAVLLHRWEGYVQEKRIRDGLFKNLTWEQRVSDVVVSWEPISLREQSAFIRGYVLYCSDNNNNTTPVVSASTDNPEATSLTVSVLKISSYTFTVKAKTAVGECGATSIAATLNSLTDYLIKTILISLFTVFGVLSLTIILCYRHWTCIKMKVYPPIPKPVLMDNWLTSLDEQSSRPFRVNLCHHAEVDVMDVPELHLKPAAPARVSQAHVPLVLSQADGCYNQSLRRGSLPPLALPAAVGPCPPGPPASHLKGVFSNPSYNLIAPPGDRQSSSEAQERTSLMRCSSGYQLQSLVEQPEEDPERSLSCILTYILLPDLPSEVAACT